MPGNLEHLLHNSESAVANRNLRTQEQQPLRPKQDGRARVAIEAVSPEIDSGRFAIKRTIDEEVQVRADIFADGHDVLSAVLRYRHESQEEWSETALQAGVNDRWSGSFTVTRLGTYFYTIQAWVNPFRSWAQDLEKKFAARVEVSVELLAGLELLQAAQARAEGNDRQELQRICEALAPANPIPEAAKVAEVLGSHVADLVERNSERLHATTYCRTLKVTVDPVLARFGSWYELFPRSCAPPGSPHGTFKDCEAFLPRIASMGFDIVYLPPVHPIGTSFRKGKNNSLRPGPDDPGSPWAIGSAEGGHKSVHPGLGTLADFQGLVQKARELNLEIALDIAFQCSPDHPYVKEHPQWFQHRGDGTIQYAENPPKKYQDIYPLDFESDDWESLWLELKSVFDFWIEQGVRVFRVDNPHTKPFGFWEWCIGEIKKNRPDVLFLAEAFTRPKVMARLAKLGFTQSYNYFPWRNTRYELTTYLTELTQTELREYFRPNLWPNTPDILTAYLQYGGRAAFLARLVLAATLGASYGIYGPPFEMCENQARELGSEEYLHSEKYEIRHWDLDRPDGLRDLITRINQVRRENPALQGNDSLVFHPTDNDQLIAYSKNTAGLENIVVTVVNLDPHHVQSGWLTLDLERWRLNPQQTFQVHDLLTGARYLWSGPRNYVQLDPRFVPAHIFRLRRYLRTEQNFDYYL